jgi:hypothetical protein
MHDDRDVEDALYSSDIVPLPTSSQSINRPEMLFFLSPQATRAVMYRRRCVVYSDTVPLPISFTKHK